jgi:hypothetical protein
MALEEQTDPTEEQSEVSTMIEMLHYTFKTVWADGDFILSRAMLLEETSPIRVASPAHAQPTRVSVAQLEYGYALRGGWTPPGPCVPSNWFVIRGS